MLTIPETIIKLEENRIKLDYFIEQNNKQLEIIDEKQRKKIIKILFEERKNIIKDLAITFFPKIRKLVE